MEKVGVYVRVYFANGGRQGATLETDSESCRVWSKIKRHIVLCGNKAEITEDIATVVQQNRLR